MSMFVSQRLSVAMSLCLHLRLRLGIYIYIYMHIVRWCVNDEVGCNVYQKVIPTSGCVMLCCTMYALALSISWTDNSLSVTQIDIHTRTYTLHTRIYVCKRVTTPIHAYAHITSRNIHYAHTNTYTQVFTYAHTCSLTHCVTDIWMHKNTHPNAHTHCVLATHSLGLS